MSGKGSSPRPYSVDKDTYDKNWDLIFGNKKKNQPAVSDNDNTGTDRNEYYDVITTEEAVLDAQNK